MLSGSKQINICVFFFTTFVLVITSWLQTDKKLRRTVLCSQQVVKPEREGGRINRETNTVYYACISRQLEVCLVSTRWIVCRAECHRVSLSTTRSHNTAVSEPSFNPLILLSGPFNNAQQTPDTPRWKRPAGVCRTRAPVVLPCKLAGEGASSLFFFFFFPPWHQVRNCRPSLPQSHLTEG